MFFNLLSYMYQSIYRTLIKFQPFTLMKVLFTEIKGNNQILNAVILTLFLHIPKHLQTNYTEDIEEKSVFHIHQGQ